MGPKISVLPERFGLSIVSAIALENDESIRFIIIYLFQGSLGGQRR